MQKEEISFFGYLKQEISKAREEKGELLAELLTAVETIPDLMGLLMRLIMDNRLNKDQRLFLSSALVYLISPEDFIPERSFGVEGLIEDSILVARTVKYFHDGNTKVYLDEHWRGDAPLGKTIDKLLQSSSLLLSDDISSAIDLYIKTNRPIT